MGPPRRTRNRVAGTLKKASADGTLTKAFGEVIAKRDENQQQAATGDPSRIPEGGPALVAQARAETRNGRLRRSLAHMRLDFVGPRAWLNFIRRYEGIPDLYYKEIYNDGPAQLAEPWLW